MAEIRIHTQARDYSVEVEPGLLAAAGERLAALVPGRRALVVTDRNVEALHLGPLIRGLRAADFTPLSLAIEPGEQHKGPETLERVYRACHLAGLTRHDVLVALGGGVVGDLAGFAAATWQRGIRLAQLPTTLMAQVDSAIGGKTAIDMPYAKNTVGAFYQPHVVLSDPELLATLPEPRLADGMAEVIKYGAIGDAALLDWLQADESRLRAVRPEDRVWIVERASRAKAAYVAEDTLDTGERMKLNFGHTVGHAIEVATGYGRYYHGEAVSLGMIIAARLGEALGVSPAGTSAALAQLLEAARLPIRAPRVALDEVIAALRGDKKLLGDELQLILLRQLGDAVIHPIRLEDLAAQLRTLWPQWVDEGLDPALEPSP